MLTLAASSCIDNCSKTTHDFAGYFVQYQYIVRNNCLFTKATLTTVQLDSTTSKHAIGFKRHQCHYIC